MEGMKLKPMTLTEELPPNINRVVLVRTPEYYSQLLTENAHQKPNSVIEEFDLKYNESSGNFELICDGVFYKSPATDPSVVPRPETPSIEELVQTDFVDANLAPTAPELFDARFDGRTLYSSYDDESHMSTYKNVLEGKFGTLEATVEGMTEAVERMKKEIADGLGVQAQEAIKAMGALAGAGVMNANELRSAFDSMNIQATRGSSINIPDFNLVGSPIPVDSITNAIGEYIDNGHEGTMKFEYERKR